MAFNGSGTFNLITGNPVVTGTTISSTWANNTLTDVASGLTNCVTRDGQSPATANLPMGNYKLTGLGQASNTGDALAWGQNATISVLTLTTALTVANGGTGAATLTGILKGNGTSAFSVATAGTDYAPATSGAAILKGNSAGGFSNATSGTDYAPATSGSAILKGNGAGGFSSAASGTDYAPATSGSSILYGNGAGGFSNVTVGSGITFSGGTLSAATVPQAVRGSLSAGQITTTSATPVTTGLAASITPVSASNKVYIQVNLNAVQLNSSTRNTYFYLYRGGTQLATFNTGPRIPSVDSYTPLVFSYIDSPATTSSTTYTVYFSTNSGLSVGFNFAGSGGNPTSDISLIEVK